MMLVCCTSEADRNSMRVGLDSLNARNRIDQPFTVADVQPYVDYFDRHGNVTGGQTPCVFFLVFICLFGNNV